MEEEFPPAHDPDVGDHPEEDGRCAPPLSDLERAILDFERQWWKQAGAKESAIRAEFSLSATRYYQVLNRLLDSPEALEAAPAVVGRLRRVRAGGEH